MKLKHVFQMKLSTLLFQTAIEHQLFDWWGMIQPTFKHKTFFNKRLRSVVTASSQFQQVPTDWMSLCFKCCWISLNISAAFVLWWKKRHNYSACRTCTSGTAFLLSSLYVQNKLDAALCTAKIIFAASVMTVSTFSVMPHSFGIHW